jgi:hypothetical protein
MKTNRKLSLFSAAEAYNQFLYRTSKREFLKKGRVKMAIG